MKRSSEQIGAPEDDEDTSDLGALNRPAYGHLKAQDPTTHRILARGLERFGAAEILERIRQENSPEGMRNFEIRLREACINLHRQVERHGADADDSLRELDRDFGKLLEDVIVLRELAESLHDGTAERLGWDKGMAEAAIVNLQEGIPALAERLQVFHFPTKGERVWTSIKEHLGKELMALGVAVGVMMSMPSVLSVSESMRAEQGQEASGFKQSGESPSGQEKSPGSRRGGNLLTDQSMPGEPDMGSAGEKPGEFERRKELAKVSGGLGNFFITQAYRFDEKGNRFFVPRSETGFHSRTPNGFIDMASAQYQKGQIVERVWRRGNSFLSELTRQGKKSDVYDLLEAGSHGKLSHAMHGRKRTGEGDSDESREYQSGDDIRHMDWKASGRRDKYLVKEFRSPEGGMRAQENFRLVIDVPSVTDYELEGLVSFFMLARKEKNIHVQEMDLYAFGKPVRRFDARMLQKTTDTATGIQGIKKLVEIIVGERTNHAIILAGGGTSWYENINMLSGTFIPDELRKRRDRDVSIVFLGVARSSEYLERWLRVKGPNPAVKKTS